MIDKDTLDVVTSVATVMTPLLLTVLGGLGWLIKQKVETAQARQDVLQAKQEAQIARLRELEDKLREDRIVTYNALLEPFFLFFTTDAAFASDPKYKGKKKDELAVSKMLSVEYRQVGFKLSLVANDEVVRAYNRLMQFFYRSNSDEPPTEQTMVRWIALMGDLFLEIRKSMGNETSALDRWEMIEWFMRDAHHIKIEHSRLEFEEKSIPG
ncbi:hypothetical protein [Methylomonas koyamae]|uniref:hypothetical protein n=1 Tax=Methylomonas koyamae TaxID=702114 RepID=UPI002873CFEA|nr:hypothetical protein [Methylomonas koyamae]WNB74966.1 hypothetical protein RI210_17005 [Methylomonas koyamae]